MPLIISENKLISKFKRILNDPEPDSSFDKYIKKEFDTWTEEMVIKLKERHEYYEDFKSGYEDISKRVKYATVLIHDSITRAAIDFGKIDNVKDNPETFSKEIWIELNSVRGFLMEINTLSGVVKEKIEELQAFYEGVKP